MAPTERHDQMHRTPWFAFVAFAMVALATGGLINADAASLGGLTSRTLAAKRQLAPAGAPTVVAWENFDGSNGTRMDGRTTTGGGLTWTALRGNWRIRANAAGVNSGDVALALTAPTPFHSIEATTVRRRTTFDVGVFANMNASGDEFITAELTDANNGELQVWRYRSGWTLLTAASNLYSGPASGWPTSAQVRLSSATGGVLTASLDGIAVATFTLSPADQAVFQTSSHRRFGLYSYNDGQSRWDDAHLDSP